MENGPGFYLKVATATLGLAKDGLQVLDGFGKVAVTVLELFRGKRDERTLALAEARIAELQQQLVAARISQLAIIDQLQQLERVAAEADRLQRDLSQYHLWRTPAGAVVLKSRDDGDHQGHHHYACYNCAQDGKKRILQPYGNSTTTLECQGCQMRFRLGAGGGGQGLETGWTLI